MKKNLFLELDEVLKTFDKDKITQFLTNRLEEFPEDLRRSIVFTLMAASSEEALKRSLAEVLMQYSMLSGLKESLEELEAEK